MKAYARTSALSQDIQLMDVKPPGIQPDEVLVKVAAFGVGIHDRYFIPQDADFPYTIGSEGSGTIMKCGAQVTEFKIGDRVIFTSILQPQGGTWAEFAAVKHTDLVSIPESMSFSTGAAIPIAGKTALECMRCLNLTKGDSLFIAGASGAIGTMVIQLASLQGISVYASASEKNQGYMQSLGAHKTVDYNDPDWKNKIIEWTNGGVNAALAIQPGTGASSIEVVKNEGRVITVSGDSALLTPERNILVQQMDHHSDTNQKMAKLVQSVSGNNLRVIIEKEYAFEQALQALEKTETRHASGKLVVNGFK